MKYFESFLFAVLAALFICAQVESTRPPRPWLEAALRTEQWLQTQDTFDRDSALFWYNVRDSAVQTSDLYSGNGGPVLFYLELWKATNDARYLKFAQHGYLGLLRSLADTLNPYNTGLYTGSAGVAYVAWELYRATGDRQYLEAGNRLLNETISVVLDSSSASQIMNDVIYGFAGVGLTCLYAHEKGYHPKALEYAQRCGKILLKKRILEGDIGLRWPMEDGDTLRGFFLPNFSHGTAGIGYFLARLHLADPNNEAWFNTAFGATLYLSERRDHRGWIQHHDPDSTQLMYLGYCHGPAGTCRLFYQIQDIVEDGDYFSGMADVSINSLLNSGIPEQRIPGYWNNAGLCCGDAGVGAFFLDLYRHNNGQDQHFKFAKKIGQYILNKAEKDPNNALFWVFSEHRSQPELLQAQTGLMQGASGIGLFLLWLDAEENGRKPWIRLPDNHF